MDKGPLSGLLTSNDHKYWKMTKLQITELLLNYRILFLSFLPIIVLYVYFPKYIVKQYIIFFQKKNYRLKHFELVLM